MVSYPMLKGPQANALPATGDPAPNAAKVTLQNEGEGLLEKIMMATVEGAKGFMIGLISLI